MKKFDYDHTKDNVYASCKFTKKDVDNFFDKIIKFLEKYIRTSSKSKDKMIKMSKVTEFIESLIDSNKKSKRVAAAVLTSSLDGTALPSKPLSYTNIPNDIKPYNHSIKPYLEACDISYDDIENFIINISLAIPGEKKLISKTVEYIESNMNNKRIKRVVAAMLTKIVSMAPENFPEE